VYCVWQVVKTPTIILNNPVYIVFIYWINYCIIAKHKGVTPIKSDKWIWTAMSMEYRSGEPYVS